MTKQRLQYLFERYIQNILTADEEKEFMNGLNAIDDGYDIDEILTQLWLDSGEPDAIADAESERRIQNVMNRVNTKKSPAVLLFFGRYGWLKAAAVLAVALSAGLWFVNHQPKTTQAALVKNTPIAIRPGGNKAYLTMANGSTIVLNDVKNGNVAVQAGIQVNKVKNGLVAYDSKDKVPAPNAATQFNTITTPRGGQYQVLLADGTKAWLNAASSLKFPVAFNGDERKVEITGEVYFEVAKDKAHPFIVKANDVNVRVLGTHFDVSAYADDDAVITTLMEGSVKMTKGTVSSLLKPGQQGIAINNKGNVTLQNADIEATEAWRKGLFIFHDETIANVMKIMARWYDVDIVYEGDVKNKEFGGSTSKDKNIVTLLENMKLTGAIHYRIDGRRVIVMN
jgi:ferric-dicitrate binding protein FerR (iron transport regulator)